MPHSIDRRMRGRFSDNLGKQGATINPRKPRKMRGKMDAQNARFAGLAGGVPYGGGHAFVTALSH